MTGQYSYARIILLVTCPENWRANIPITIQCSTVRPGFASNLELKACEVDPGVHQLLAYLVWVISDDGGLDLEVVPSGTSLRCRLCESHSDWNRSRI
jgi:hypothetical protein